MSQLPASPPSPEQQQRIMGQVYMLMAKQIKSFHRHHRMGENSSVPVELAQEMMESIEYTINQAGGAYAYPEMEEGLKIGQGILENKLHQARSLLELVIGTEPDWQTECRWDAICCLRRYLDQYDFRHLAHKGPNDLFYPILIAPPEGIQGIDSCLFYLNILWIENQIMAGVSEDALEQFWQRLPADALNQCEHLLINGVGKALLGAGLEPLTFEPEERMQIAFTLRNATEEKLRSAAKLLCRWLELSNEHACMYVEAVIPQFRMWIGENGQHGIVEGLFI